MYTVEKIADWFIARSRAEIRMDEDAEPITKMKLQKLLYFSQGVNLAVHDARLFDGTLFAFKHGPVTEEIQNRYPSGTRNLPEFNDDITEQRENELADNFDALSKDEAATEVLDFVWENYGKYTAAALRNLSHDPKGPWAAIFDPNVPWNEMNDEEIARYFKEEIVDVD